MNMPAPSVTLQHLKTSQQYEGADLIMRYWFEWSNRKNLSKQVVRIDLLDEAGNVLTTSSVKLPKVKITGFIPATPISDPKPIYDSTVWIQIDDIVRPERAASFRYYTLTGLMSKSEQVTSKMDGKYEDLSMYA